MSFSVILWLVTMSSDVIDVWQCNYNITLTLTLNLNKENKSKKKKKKKLNKEISIQASDIKVLAKMWALLWLKSVHWT